MAIPTVNTSERNLTTEYRQDSDIRELQRSVDKLEKKMDGLVDSVTALRIEIRDLHTDAVKHADSLHADSISQINTAVWKTVGLLSAIAAIVKYVMS